MMCYTCKDVQLIWNDDVDISEENEMYFLLTILTCPQCDSMVEVYQHE